MHTRTDSTQVNLTLISQTPLSTTRSSLILWQSPVPCPLHSMKRMARLWLWLDLSTHCINSCNKLALGLDQGLSGAKRGWRGGTGRVELESWVTTFLSLLAWLSKNVFRFPVWFSCHSFVKLFCFFFFSFQKMQMYCRECVNACACVSGWPSWQLPAVKMALWRLFKCDWGT